ncbi:MAG TPA: hypothetical protein DEB06_11810 [Phycisphaerales bacterium]|nr:hypothetical protein [Phycisphaerales bacterium]
MLSVPAFAGVGTFGPEQPAEAPSSPGAESSEPGLSEPTKQNPPVNSPGSAPKQIDTVRPSPIVGPGRASPVLFFAAPDPTPPAPPPVAVELRAGSGFAGPTLEPSVVGTPGTPGITAKAIAHWDAVPNQLFSGSFNLGVVAFHLNDIDRVEFSLNGGPWFPVRQMSLNPRTGVWEYWTPVNGRSFPDGRAEVRAIAYPKAGQPRLLEPIVLFNNSGGSIKQAIRYVSPTGNDTSGDGTAQKPFATIFKAADSIRTASSSGKDASFGTIYLTAGDHTFAGRPAGGLSVQTEQGWLTIAAAPGTARDKVRLTGNTSKTGGLNSAYLRLRNLTLSAMTLTTATSANSACWFDGCDLVGTGPDDASRFATPSTWTGGVYYTDTSIRKVRIGMANAKFARGVSMETIGSDAFHNPRVVINCSAKDVLKPVGSTYHPDLIQFNGAFDNVIVYGLKTQNINAQGIFSRGSDDIPDRNMAFVNVMIDQRTHLSQWLQAADHVLFRNVMILGRAMNFSNDAGKAPNVLTNFSVEGCVFQELRIDPLIVPHTDKTVFRNNHFVAGKAMGSGTSMGDPRLVNPLQGRFEPRADSPLAKRLTSQDVPVDILGQQRKTPGAIGPFEVAAAQ